MSESWRTIRVFISSTFRDMQAERDHLVRFVFPSLREELHERRLGLDEVDLRWGVTAEQDTLEACREIIDDCRPRFLCLLGGSYGTVPPGADRSITAGEVQHAVLDQPARPKYAFFYLRDPAVTLAMEESAPGDYREPEGSQSALKLTELKKAIADTGLPLFVYPARWDPEEHRITGLEVFGERVRFDLLRSVDDEFGAAPAAAPEEFEAESAAMDQFVERHVQHFVAGHRQPFLDQIAEFARGTKGAGVLLVTAAPGLGKTALLSRFCWEVATAKSPRDMLIAHFVGVSSRSTDVRVTLQRICHELAHTVADLKALPTTIPLLRERFLTLLGRAAGTRRVVLVVDAVNRFDTADPDEATGWLPSELPPGVRVIVSSLPGVALEILKRRFPAAQTLSLPPLDDADARAIIDEFLARYRKRMTPDQIAALLKKSESRSPLYLTIALEELRTLGTHFEITERILSLPGEVRALVSWILRRLSGDPGFRDAAGHRAGAELVRGFASFLAASRHGLSAREMADLTPLPANTQGNLAALIALLRPYLMRRRELIDFYHDEFREAVLSEQFDNPETRAQVHRRLAAFFATRVPDPRGLSELPFHQGAAGLFGELEATLTDFSFLEAKCRAGMVFDLSADYERAIAEWPAPVPVFLTEFADALRNESYHLIDRPETAFQQLYYYLQSSADSSVRIALERGSHLFAQAQRPWMRTLYRGPPHAAPDRAQKRSRLLTEHKEDVRCAAASNDGSIGGSASERGQLKVYRIPGGEPLWESFEEVPVLVQNVQYAKSGRGPVIINVPLTPETLTIDPDRRTILLQGTAPASCVREWGHGNFGVTHRFSGGLKWHAVHRDLRTGELLDRPPGSPPPSKPGHPWKMFRSLGDGVTLHSDKLEEETTGRSLGRQPAKTEVECCWRSAQGARMALVALGNRVEMWDLQQFLAAGARGEMVTGISRLEVSSQGPCVLAVAGHRLLFWDFSKPQFARRTFDWPGQTNALALSNCGSRAAWLDRAGAMVIVDTSSGGTLSQFAIATGRISGCRFHTADTLLVWGAKRCSLWKSDSNVWQIEFRTYIRDKLPPLYAPPLLLIFDYGSISVYDTKGGAHLCDLRTEVPIENWSFDPVTSTLVTIHRHRTVMQDDWLESRIWTIQPIRAGTAVRRSLRAALARRILGNLATERNLLTNKPPRHGPAGISLCRPTSRGGLVWREGRTIRYQTPGRLQDDIVVSTNIIADFSVSADGAAVAWVDENGTVGWRSLQDGTTIQMLAAARMVSCHLDHNGRRVVALDLTGHLHVYEVQLGA